MPEVYEILIRDGEKVVSVNELKDSNAENLPEDVHSYYQNCLH